MAFADTLGGPATGGGAGESGRAGGEGTLADHKPGAEKQGQDPVGSLIINLELPEDKGRAPRPDSDEEERR